MAGCPILVSMASLTFLFNQMSSLASTLTLSLVILWCSCAQCSPTAVSELLLSCDRRQGDHVTSEGEALRPEEEYAKYSKASQ